MVHYFITNREVRRDGQHEYINEDGSESAGENLRCGIFESNGFSKDRPIRNFITLFPDSKEVVRTEEVIAQPPATYHISDIKKKHQDLTGSTLLFTELYKAMSGQHGGDLLFFIHGFNNNLAEVLTCVCELEKKYVDDRSPIKHIVFFTWPAMKKILRYRNDAKDAELSGYTLARCYLMLIDFFQAMFLKTPGSKAEPLKPCGHNIHLLAHSMGNRVLEHMLIELYHQKGENLTALFKEVILAASDVDWQVFESPRAFYNLINICQRSTVYFHTGDVALLVSETTKNAYNRLGKYGFRDFHKVPSHVYSVDCSGVSDQKGLGSKVISHAYYVESDNVAEDIVLVLQGVNAEDFVGLTRNPIPGNAAQYRLRAKQ